MKYLYFASEVQFQASGTYDYTKYLVRTIDFNISQILQCNVVLAE